MTNPCHGPEQAVNVAEAHLRAVEVAANDNKNHSLDATYDLLIAQAELGLGFAQSQLKVCKMAVKAIENALKFAESRPANDGLAKR